MAKTKAELYHEIDERLKKFIGSGDTVVKFTSDLELSMLFSRKPGNNTYTFHVVTKEEAHRKIVAGEIDPRDVFSVTPTMTAEISLSFNKEEKRYDKI